MRRFLKRIAWWMSVAITATSAAMALGSSGDKPTSLNDMLPKMPKPRFNFSVTDLKAAADHDRARDPLKYLAQDLGQITNALSSMNTAKPVQDEEAAALKRMDDLIAELEKACKQGRSGGANPNPTSPMTSPRITGGPGGEGELHDPKQGSKNWGDLPPREREQILQARTEGFPAGYEGLLESYYRRLSQEQVSPDSTTAPAPAHPADSTAHQAAHP